MSTAPAALADNTQPYSWKIVKQGLEAAEVFAVLYNLAKPKERQELTIAEATAAIGNAMAIGQNTIGKFRGVNVAFAPYGNTTGNPKAWDLYTYLKANPHVSVEDIRNAFGEAVQWMPIRPGSWREAANQTAPGVSAVCGR